MLSGFDPAPGRIKSPKSIMLESEPADFLALADFDPEGLKSSMDRVLSIVHWPGEPGYVPPAPPPPLSEQEQARFERGRQVYSVTCIACHKHDGLGQEGLAPPLVDSEWVLGPQGRLVRIIVNGLRGPINVSGTVYSFDMPGLSKLSDDEIAAVATFVRRSWDHGASPVESDTVAKVRAANRPMPWSESELLKVP
jgi:mono/diheme cytochrome c family protein